MTLIDKYPKGTEMAKLKHLPEISGYNENFYVGLNKDLIYGASDDDNFTEWYLVDPPFNQSTYFGYSYTSEGNRLHPDTKRMI